MSKKFKFISSSALFTTPSFLKGTSRVVDMFGTLNNYNYKETGAEADLESLKRDWGIVGLDIANAIGIYEKEETIDSRPTEFTGRTAIQQ